LFKNSPWGHKCPQPRGFKFYWVIYRELLKNSIPRTKRYKIVKKRIPGVADVHAPKGRYVYIGLYSKNL